MDKHYWNPYFGGFILGTLLFLTFAIASQGFGASGTFSRLSAQLLVSSDNSWLQNDYISHYFQKAGNALLNWTVIETLGIFIGGFLSALFAGRFAIQPDKANTFSTLKRLLFAFIGGIFIAYATRLTRGCTSGQGLDGMATFSVGAWIFMLSAFAAALVFSPFFRTQWVNNSKEDKS